MASLKVKVAKTNLIHESHNDQGWPFNLFAHFFKRLRPCDICDPDPEKDQGNPCNTFIRSLPTSGIYIGSENFAFKIFFPVI